MYMSPTVSSLHIVSIVFTRTDNNTMHYADKVQSIQSIQAVSEVAYRQHIIIISDFIVSRIVNYKFTLLFVSNLSLWSYPWNNWECLILPTHTWEITMVAQNRAWRITSENVTSAEFSERRAKTDVYKTQLFWNQRLEWEVKSSKVTWWRPTAPWPPPARCPPPPPRGPASASARSARLCPGYSCTQSPRPCCRSGHSTLQCCRHVSSV